ncbi:MAG: alpha/beta hydrolase [Proteobacteria bacterium]|nr:alpha/beta hydrolase [Pseudomonadota bacterium]
MLKQIIFFLIFFALNAEAFLLQEEVTPLSSGRLSWVQRNPEADQTIIFIPANSTSKRIFRKQLTSSFFDQRLIAVDLPGHGASENALNPSFTYSFEGYAASLIEFIEMLHLKTKPVLCGWSLGGHVAIEILRLRPDLVAGLFLTGTPPIDLTPEGFNAGFKPFLGCELMSKDHFTKEDAVRFISLLWPSYESFMVDDAERTDGKARSLMIAQALSGKRISQRQTIENTLIPLAFVIGTADEGINGDYIKGLAFKKAPEIHEISAGHDTIWGAADDFNERLNTFVRKIYG